VGERSWKRRGTDRLDQRATVAFIHCKLSISFETFYLFSSFSFFHHFSLLSSSFKFSDSLILAFVFSWDNKGEQSKGVTEQQSASIEGELFISLEITFLFCLHRLICLHSLGE
jgi:hypothetical protein